MRGLATCKSCRRTPFRTRRGWAPIGAFAREDVLVSTGAGQTRAVGVKAEWRGASFNRLRYAGRARASDHATFEIGLACRAGDIRELLVGEIEARVGGRRTRCDRADDVRRVAACVGIAFVVPSPRFIAHLRLGGLAGGARHPGAVVGAGAGHPAAAVRVAAACRAILHIVRVPHLGARGALAGETVQIQYHYSSATQIRDVHKEAVGRRFGRGRRQAPGAVRGAHAAAQFVTQHPS